MVSPKPILDRRALACLERALIDYVVPPLATADRFNTREEVADGLRRREAVGAQGQTHAPE